MPHLVTRVSFQWANGRELPGTPSKDLLYEKLEATPDAEAFGQSTGKWGNLQHLLGEMLLATPHVSLRHVRRRGYGPEPAREAHSSPVPV